MRNRLLPFILMFILGGCVDEIDQYSESDSLLQNYLDLGFEVSFDNNSDITKVASLEEAKKLILEFEKQCEIINEGEVGYAELLPKTRANHYKCFAHIICAHNGYDEVLDFMYNVYLESESNKYELGSDVVYDILPKLPLVGTYETHVRSASEGNGVLYISTYFQRSFTVQSPGGTPPISYYNTLIFYWTFILKDGGVYYGRSTSGYPRLIGGGTDFGNEEEGVWVRETFK